MAGERTARILTLNSGSSSLKFSVHELGSDERLVMSGAVRRIGSGGALTVGSPEAGVLIDRQLDAPNHEAAVRVLLDWLEENSSPPVPDAVGHRVVHGGARYQDAEIIDDGLLHDLERLISLAPDHLPREIVIIQAARHAFADVDHIACFDTSFHRSMPEVARLYALPRDLEDQGILRYGFHGLSYEYITAELRGIAGSEADGRVVVAHLGSGASMVALRGGRSVDTTMGFTPAGGLVMSTRCGDLDPGVLVHLLEEGGWSAREVNELINKRSGLLGVSGVSPDMQEGHRPLLLSSAQVCRSPDSRARRARHPGVHGRYRGELAGGEEAHLSGARIPGCEAGP
jgi:acetate kinase